MGSYGPIEPIVADHEAAGFDCGLEAQTLWLRRHALQAHRAGTSRIFVVCAAVGRRVVGYYALAAGSVEPEAAPGRIAQGTGHHPIPVVVVARLGVDAAEQGKGLGRALVRDALLRVAGAAGTIGICALLIHAESPPVRAFYLRLAEFEPSPSDPLHLFLLMKDLRAAIDAD